MTGTTKTRTSIWSSQAVNSGGGNVQSGTQVRTTGYGCELLVSITNGASDLDDLALVELWVSHDNTNFYKYHIFIHDSDGAGDTYEETFRIPIGVKYYYLLALEDDAEDYTVTAEDSEITAINV